VFEWDEGKARRNETKHGVSFREAATAFFDEDRIERPDLAHSAAERRTICLGRSDRGRVLCIVFTRRGPDGETTRLISARQASRRERAVYRALHTDRD
jgi:uncharacterized DUF497 family protein